MDVPLTKSGAKCKKCMAKGSACHLHGGTPAAKTPAAKSVGKKSPPKVSRSPTEEEVWSFHRPPGKHVTAAMASRMMAAARPKRASPKKLSPKQSPKKLSPKSPSPRMDFERLPAPVVYDALLRMAPKELHALCSSSRKIKTICDSQRFRQDYLASHKIRRSLFDGKLVLETKQKVPGNNTWSYNYELHFGDDGRNGNARLIVTAGGGSTKVKRIRYQLRSMFIDLIRRDKRWIVKIGPRLAPRNGPEIIKFLTEIDRMEWYPGERGRFTNKNREKEVAAQIIADIKRHLSKSSDIIVAEDREHAMSVRGRGGYGEKISMFF